MGALGGLLGIGGGNAPGAGNVGSTDAQRNLASAYFNDALGKQATYANQQAQGIGNQNAVFQQQQDLANALQQQTQGGGPNPALQQLANTTGQNVSQQAALMAGQRGAGANVGLMARQAAGVGAGVQQQAVGQGALMRMQQQLAAQQQLQQQQQNMGNIANTQSAQQLQGISNLGNMTLNNQGQMLGAMANAQALNSQAQQGQAQRQGQFIGGLGNAAGAALGTLGGSGEMSEWEANGGHYAVGGQVSSGPQSSFAKHLLGLNAPQKSEGGLVDIVVSPGEKIVPPEQVNSAAKGMAQGQTVPGKAKVSGDSQKNDTVPMKVPPGTVVVKRTMAKNSRDSATFVRNVLAKRGRK